MVGGAGGWGEGEGEGVIEGVEAADGRWRGEGEDGGGEVVMSAVSRGEITLVALLSPSSPSPSPPLSDPYLTDAMRQLLTVGGGCGDEMGQAVEGAMALHLLPHPSLTVVLHPSAPSPLLAPPLLLIVLHVQCTLHRIQAAAGVPVQGGMSAERPFAHHPDLQAVRAVREYGVRGAGGMLVRGRMRRDGGCVIVCEVEKGEEGSEGDEERGKRVWSVGWQVVESLSTIS